MQQGISSDLLEHGIKGRNNSHQHKQTTPINMGGVQTSVNSNKNVCHACEQN